VQELLRLCPCLNWEKVLSNFLEFQDNFEKFLGEKMNKLKWLGVSLIIVGVSFIGLGNN